MEAKIIAFGPVTRDNQETINKRGGTNFTPGVNAALELLFTRTSSSTYDVQDILNKDAGDPDNEEITFTSPLSENQIEELEETLEAGGEAGDGRILGYLTTQPGWKFFFTAA